MDSYEEFIAGKVPADPATGIDIDPALLSKYLKDFQRAVTVWSLKRGRAALFKNTGLGKSIDQLSWARAVVDYTGKPVLGLAPLAVSQQTIGEAAKFEIAGVSYAADKTQIKSDIVVTNYERFSKFDIDKFGGIFLDESGLLKSVEGKTRIMLTEACQDLPWKLCCSATPAPNDYTELGQHAEFLGVMTAKEMLSMFFVHEGSLRAENGAPDWRLKKHATADFWRWLASWAVMIRHPSDLGFDEPGYDLPPLNYHQVTVASNAEPEPGTFFAVAARTLHERISARRSTVDMRVAAAAEIVKQAPGEQWLIWCGLNEEADKITAVLSNYGAKQVTGSDPVDKKIELLLGFVKGTPRILVTKPSIAGHGLNFQNCSRMIFIGLSDSFEQLYQAIRRCWRFGQTKQVEVYLIASDLEGFVVDNLKRKETDFENMLDAMTMHMRELTQAAVRGGRIAVSDYKPTKIMELPRWLI